MKKIKYYLLLMAISACSLANANPESAFKTLDLLSQMGRTLSLEKLKGIDSIVEESKTQHIKPLVLELMESSDEVFIEKAIEDLCFFPISDGRGFFLGAFCEALAEVVGPESKFHPANYKLHGESLLWNCLTSDHDPVLLSWAIVRFFEKTETFPSITEINKEYSGGETLLSIALGNAKPGNFSDIWLDIAKSLIAKGAKVNCFVNGGNLSMLAFLMIEKSLGFDYLINVDGIDLDAKPEGHPERAPLYIAIQMFSWARDEGKRAYYKQAAIKLIECGADINVQGDDGQTPLKLAQELQDSDIWNAMMNRTISSGEGVLPEEGSIEAVVDPEELSIPEYVLSTDKYTVEAYLSVKRVIDSLLERGEISPETNKLFAILKVSGALKEMSEVNMADETLASIMEDISLAD